MTVVAPASAPDAWARWADFPSWETWNPHCIDARLEGALEEGTRVALHLTHPRGRDFYTRPRLTAVDPGRELSWEARALGLRATTRTLFAPEPDGTRVTIEVRSEGPMAVAYRLGMTDRTQALIYVGMLDALTDSLRT